MTGYLEVGRDQAGRPVGTVACAPWLDVATVRRPHCSRITASCGIHAAHGRIRLTADGKEHLVSMQTAPSEVDADSATAHGVAVRRKATTQEIAVGALIGIAAIGLKVVLNAVLGGETGYLV